MFIFSYAIGRVSITVTYTGYAIQFIVILHHTESSYVYIIGKRDDLTNPLFCKGWRLICGHADRLL